MPDARTVAGHYAHGDLLGAIRRGVESLGKTVGDVDVDDLAPVDEFHIGGRAATDAFLDPLGIAADEHWLDVGCGLGGAARLAARRFGCRVTGIDLTPDYVATGTALCEWVGLQERVTLSVEDGRSLPHADGAFDGAYLLHVGMNVPDKPALFAELHRVVRPGGRLAVYDVMRTGAGELAFPVPWAADAEGSAVSSPDEYRRALEAAGWRVAAERDRRDFAVEFFARMQARASEGQGPPPLGIHILMGETAPLKVANMIANIERGVIAPVELVAEKSGENSAEEPAGEAR